MPAALPKPRGLFAKAIFCLYSMKSSKTVHAKAIAIRNQRYAQIVTIGYRLQRQDERKPDGLIKI